MWQHCLKEHEGANPILSDLQAIKCGLCSMTTTSTTIIFWRWRKRLNGNYTDKGSKETKSEAYFPLFMCLFNLFYILLFKYYISPFKESLFSFLFPFNRYQFILDYHFQEENQLSRANPTVTMSHTCVLCEIVDGWVSWTVCRTWTCWVGGPGGTVIVLWSEDWCVLRQDTKPQRAIGVWVHVCQLSATSVLMYMWKGECDRYF